MTTIEALILGIIEGLTEFLPVSSTGHLILTNRALGIDPADATTQVFLFVSQIGAILAVVLYFWRDLWRRLLAAPPAGWRSHIVTKLAVAFTPSVIVGLAANDFMELYLENNPVAVAVALIIGAGLIELIDRRCRREKPMELEDVTLRQAFYIGIAQCISIIPGTSRAAATIMGGMLVGLSPRVATEFSFYLAIPTMFAAGGYRLLKHHDKLSADSAGVILFGTAVAFIVALLVVAGFMSYVRRYRFTPFAIYRVILGAVVLLTFFTGWL